MLLFFYSDGTLVASGSADMQQHGGLTDRYTSSGSNRMIVSIGDQKMLVPKKAPTMPKPVWHAPWKLFRVRTILSYLLLSVNCCYDIAE